MLTSLLSFFIAIGFLMFCAAHPAGYEELHTYQAAASTKLTEKTNNKLSQCSDHLKKRGIQIRADLRRATLLQSYRQQLLGTNLATTAYNSSAMNPLKSLSTFEKTDCVLTPESTIGPFWVRGEFIRSNITDEEIGIPLILDGYFVDVNTCEPIEDLYWEIWSCNSNGRYSGVLEHGKSHHHNLNKTFLRGLQKTDKDGSAQFQTIFPGHYAGRATHIHVLAHIGATVLPNNTLTGGHIPHISQLFFDQELIKAVEATSPYRENKAPVTPNSEDGIFHAATGGGKYNPILSYTLLGDKLTDGILASVTMGIDVSASYGAPYAAKLTDHGGVAYVNSWLKLMPSFEWLIKWLGDVVKRLWGSVLWL